MRIEIFFATSFKIQDMTTCPTLPLVICYCLNIVYYSERKLFIGMVCKKLNEDDIKDMFIQFGPIEECTVLRDDNGISRGWNICDYFLS